MSLRSLTVAALAGGALWLAAGALEAQSAPVAHQATAASSAAPAPSSVSERGSKTEISLMRDSFSYSADGRRDPFVSLLTSGELRPMLSDLKLVTVVYDPTGRSVAVLRDLTTKEQYRVKSGQTLGRMRVAQIQPRSVTFTLEELGFSRQEVLALNDTTKARSQ